MIYFLKRIGISRFFSLFPAVLLGAASEYTSNYTGHRQTTDPLFLPFYPQYHGTFADVYAPKAGNGSLLLRGFGSEILQTNAGQTLIFPPIPWDIDE